MDENYNPNQMNNYGTPAGGNPPQPTPNPQYQPQYQQPTPQYQQPQYQQPTPTPQYQQPQYQQPTPTPQYQPQQAAPTPQYQQQGQFNQPQGQQYQPAFGGAAPVQTKKKNNGAVIGIIVAIIAVAIIGAVLLTSLANPQRKFYGEWTVEQDYTEKINESFESSGMNLGDDFSFVVTFNVVFNDNNTYSITLDKKTFDDARAKYVEHLKKALIEYEKETYPILDSYSDEELEKELEKYLGKSIEDYIDEELAEYTYEYFSNKVNLHGQFKVSGDKLYLSAGEDYVVDEHEYGTFEVNSNNEIVINEYYIDDLPGNSPFILPMTLVRK